MTASPQPPAVWRGETSLTWRADEFGNAARALFAGGIEVGSVMFQEFDWASGPPGKTARGKPWRAWTPSGDGVTDDPVLWFATEREAKDAVVEAAIKGLSE